MPTSAQPSARPTAQVPATQHAADSDEPGEGEDAEHREHERELGERAEDRVRPRSRTRRGWPSASRRASASRRSTAPTNGPKMSPGKPEHKAPQRADQRADDRELRGADALGTDRGRRESRSRTKARSASPRMTSTIQLTRWKSSAQAASSSPPNTSGTPGSAGRIAPRETGKYQQAREHERPRCHRSCGRPPQRKPASCMASAARHPRSGQAATLCDVRRVRFLSSPSSTRLPELQAALADASALRCSRHRPARARARSCRSRCSRPAGWADGRIVMLEPRRVAARAVATRMAPTLGENVGGDGRLPHAHRHARRAAAPVSKS